MKILKEVIRLPQKLTMPTKTKGIQHELLTRPMPPVTDAVTQQVNVDLGREIRRLENDVEKIRKQLTKPLNDTVKAINKICADYVEPLAERREQLEDAVTEFQKAEQKRVQLEEASRAEELKRLQAPVETNGDVAMQELVAYRQEQAAEELMRAPSPEPAKASGAAFKQVMRYEVTDIHALYAARPDLCNPPTEKPSAILAVCVPEIEVPGLRCWYEKQTIIRTL